MKRLLFLTCAAAAMAQETVSLEQASSRSGQDLVAVFEGRNISVQGQVMSSPVWALGTYYVAVRDASDHGLLLSGDRDRFSELAAGDWIEATGTIQSRASLPLLIPSAVRVVRHDSRPEPKELAIGDLLGFRYLGLTVRTSGTVTGAGDNLGGKTIEIADRGNTIGLFIPRPTDSTVGEFRRVHVGDRVRLTAVATQYSVEAPHDSGFQLLLASADQMEIVPSGTTISPWIWVGALAFVAGGTALWWIRGQRQGSQRKSMRAFHALSEDIISASSPTEIAEKLATVLPTITQATGVRLYLYNRRTKCLERVPTKSDPDPMAVPVDSTPDGLASGAVVCFRNRTLINVPDVRRSPFVKVDSKSNLPRSAMFLPLFAHTDVLGVLEVGNARRLGYFSVEEQAAAQHLANQVAASLKLQEQQRVREQLFRSEKLAATGQLISGVASELRAPIESILQLATSLAAYGGRNIPERELRMLAGESQRASEIVSRLVSFARPEDAGARQVDLNNVVASLMQFRDPEWKTLGIRVHDRLSADPVIVLGSQGQMEQVFLNLLVHAEQFASESPGKTITVSSSMIAKRVLVEISYSIGEKAANPFVDGATSDNGVGLAVCQGIVHGHGGEIRFGNNSGMARFEVELPVLRADATRVAQVQQARSALTFMLVEPDHAAQRQMIATLSARGHRAVPVAPEEAPDLAQRLRFNAVFWASRSVNGRTGEYQERVRSLTPSFVLVVDAFDSALAESVEDAGGFLLSRPIKDADLDRVLERIESRPNTSSGRAGR